MGFTLVEVAGKTFLQRLASDEVLARVFASQETLRLAAAAAGSIAAPLLVALFGIKGALLAAGAVMPLFAVARWGALRAFETGAPVDSRPLRAAPRQRRSSSRYRWRPSSASVRTWCRSRSTTGPR